MPRSVLITLLAATLLSFCLIDYNRRLIGIREDGSNSGEEVKEIQSHCNLQANRFEWCAATVLIGHKECNYDYPKLFPCLASSWFDSTHTVYKRGDPKSLIKEGQVAGYYVRSKGRIGHAGTVLSVADDYALIVEGNSRDVGNKLQPGEGVHLLRRSLDEITVTADWQKQSVHKYHTVMQGETLYRLSVMHKTTVSELQRLNNLSGAIISIGQRVRVR